MNERGWQGAALAVALAAACGAADGMAAAAQGAVRAGPGAAPALRDTAFLGQYATAWRLRLGDPSKFTPTPAGDAVLFLRAPSGRSRDLALWSFDPATGRDTLLARAADLLAGAEETLTPEERARRERLRQTAAGIATFELSKDGATVLVPLASRLFLIERATGRARELASANGPAADAGLSPDGRSVAVVRDGGLWVMDAVRGAERRLAAREGDVTWGLAEFVAQEEMGRLRGFWWAPDSRRLLAQRTDVAGVERLHIADPARPERAPEEWAYPRAGTRNADVRLWLFDLARDDSLEVRWDRARWPYLCTVAWSEGAPLTLVVMNRRQTEAAVLAADEATGATRPLHVERDAAWLNLDQSVPRWVEGGRAWLWSSERGGRWALELRARSGALLRTLTTAADGYRRLLAVDEARGVAWVLGGDDPLEQHVLRVPLRPRAGARTGRVTAPGGWHDGHFGGGAGEVWVEARERLDGARAFVVRRADGGEAGAIVSHAETPLVTPRPEIFTAGPRALRVRVLRPADFVAGRRYPVVLQVYGGPHHQDVTVRTRRMLMDQWLANQGFIVVAVDGRGTPNRGRAWERAIAGNLLDPAMDDQVAGLRAAAARVPEMDLTRVGVTGGSFGGTMTALALMTRPDVFHAGVSFAPVVDWRDYDTFYTERYLGLPDERPEAYRASSPLTYAARLERPLLLVHGTADDNVYFFHSLKLLDALTAAGRAVEFLPIVGQTHVLRDPVAMRRIEERTVEFFKRHLGEPR